jgi:hypothetical protein
MKRIFLSGLVAIAAQCANTHKPKLTKEYLIGLWSYTDSASKTGFFFRFDSEYLTSAIGDAALKMPYRIAEENRLIFDSKENGKKRIDTCFVEIINADSAIIRTHFAKLTMGRIHPRAKK